MELRKKWLAFLIWFSDCSRDSYSHLIHRSNPAQWMDIGFYWTLCGLLLVLQALLLTNWSNMFLIRNRPKAFHCDNSRLTEYGKTLYPFCIVNVWAIIYVYVFLWFYWSTKIGSMWQTNKQLVTPALNYNFPWGSHTHTHTYQLNTLNSMCSHDSSVQSLEA